MRELKESHFLNYPPELIFDIIKDAKKYPEFLPWCKNVEILSEFEGGYMAEMTVSFKGITESYNSRVEYGCTDGIYFVKVNSVSGLFRELNNDWHILSKENGSFVDFYLAFEFKSKILDTVAGMFFASVTQKMIAAFESRASNIVS